MEKSLILGAAVTGAKFTPTNHAPTGNALIDLVSTGETIKSDVNALVAEASSLYEVGVRYYHYHARNPETHEQTTSNSIYSRVSLEVQDRLPEMFLSFGASRNGPEVRQSILENGEWERVSQSALPLHMGGAHFVTKQAAVELQIIIDLKRQGVDISPQALRVPSFLDALKSYKPSEDTHTAKLDLNSTTQGGNYGSTAPSIQMETYARAVESRRKLGLLHEVEWVQLDRSYAMTKFAIDHPAIRLGSEGQLSITLLYGFSPKFPFPSCYEDFRKAIDLAKSLEYDYEGNRVRRVTISVGAAVIPQQAEDHVKPLEFGPRKGKLAGPLERLSVYAAHEANRVDILRFGMEDTPYIMSSDLNLMPSDNLNLGLQCAQVLEECGVKVITDPKEIRTRMAMELSAVKFQKKYVE